MGLAQGEPKDKPSPLTRDTLDFDLALVFSQNSLADRQAKAGPLSLGREERNEELTDVLSGDSDPLILNEELEPRR